MFKFLLPVCFAATLNLCFASELSFLAFGDMPYTDEDKSMLTGPEGSLFKAGRAANHQFVVHVGDLKAGGKACTESLLQGNFALLQALSDKPLVYTPGDNDWTDCDRTFLFPSYDELKRLDYVRQHFATQTLALPDFKRQADFPENQSWQHSGIGFVTLHVTGTNNGRRQILQSDEKQALKLTEQRDKANLAWLSQALQPELKAAVVFMQADLFQQQKYQVACGSEQAQKCDGFKLYRDKLTQFAATLPYPLLLVHGDTGEFCLSQRPSGLWRLNAPGDFRVLDIARVTVKPGDELPFRVQGLLAQKNAPVCKE